MVWTPALDGRALVILLRSRDCELRVAADAICSPCLVNQFWQIVVAA
jgi:hypothetical protein